MRKSPQIVFLDMEGTLLSKAYHLDDGRVAPSTWTLMAEALGDECLREENESKDVWNAGGYRSYLDWMAATVQIHKKHGLSESLFLQVLDQVQFVTNVDQVLSRLLAKGVKTALITGGFKALADKVQKRLKIHHAFAGCEYFFDPASGLIDHVNLLPADELGKVDFVNLMCREYQFSPADCLFIGDGKNDVNIARAVGWSIAFNAQSELRDVSTWSIEQGIEREDFLAVWDLMAREFQLQ